MSDAATIQSPSEILYKRILIAMLDKERRRINATAAVRLRTSRLLNPERTRLVRLAWVARNKEKLKLYKQTYREKYGVDVIRKAEASAVKLWRIKNKERHKLYGARWRLSNPEKIKEYKRREVVKHHEKIKARVRKYYHAVGKFKKRIRKWTPELRAKHKILADRWRENNIERVRESGRMQQRRMRSDPLMRIITRFRTRINRYAKKPSRAPMWTLLGCTGKEFRAHIENQFGSRMSWSNYGYGENKWVIDHRLPVASFDHSIPENVEKCWHHSNLQPMWWRDNMAKRDKV